MLRNDWFCILNCSEHCSEVGSYWKEGAAVAAQVEEERNDMGSNLTRISPSSSFSSNRKISHFGQCQIMKVLINSCISLKWSSFVEAGSIISMIWVDKKLATVKLLIKFYWRCKDKIWNKFLHFKFFSFLNCAIPCLFFFTLILSMQFLIQFVVNRICQWLDLNRGPRCWK